MIELHAGQRINNYLLEERVGAGSFGDVWRARHHVFDQTVAIKVPTEPQFVRNLQREGVAVHGIRHENIVRVIDLDPYAEPPYLIMEYVDGPSLRQGIDEYKARFPIPAAVRILRGVLSALSVAHEKGLIHRDIKPANILLAWPLTRLAEIDESRVKVTDFGLGRVGGQTTVSILQSGSLLTEEGRSIAGTLAYMAPEQRDGQNVDARADLYACGVVFFEMLTGVRPEGMEVPSTLRAETPVFLDEVFRRAYARVDRRYSSAAEMLADLSRPPPPGSAPAGMHGRAAGNGPPPPPYVQFAPGGAICPRCGGERLDDDNFCIYCGHQLVDAVPRCHACGQVVAKDDRFCVRCGVQMNNG